jgi:hypothetical protein
MTFRSPPLTVPELERLEQDLSSQFSSHKAFVDSWEACKDWYAEKHYTITIDAARGWMERDLDRDKVVNFRFTHADPLAEAHPSQYEIPDSVEQHAIQHGDMHDWSELEPIRHAAICVRCQMGTAARQAVDARAAAAGQTPFPGGRLADALNALRGRIQRCDDCGVLEDELATDACQRSFWHLPDIWLALHPGEALDAMGTLGPFMRGFLRRQRPA